MPGAASQQNHSSPLHSAPCMHCQPHCSGNWDYKAAAQCVDGKQHQLRTEIEVEEMLVISHPSKRVQWHMPCTVAYSGPLVCTCACTCLPRQCCQCTVSQSACFAAPWCSWPAAMRPVRRLSRSDTQGLQDAVLMICIFIGCLPALLRHACALHTLQLLGMRLPVS